MSRRVICLAAVNENGSIKRYFIIPGIDLVFEFVHVKVKRRHFLNMISFSASVHKAQEWIFKKWLSILEQLFSLQVKYSLEFLGIKG